MCWRSSARWACSHKSRCLSWRPATRSATSPCAWARRCALAASPPSHAVELVAYATEEPPHFAGPRMGSAVHAQGLRDAGTPVRLMLSLEMIGYFSDAPGSQRYPVKGLSAVYGDRGDFLALIAPFSASDMQLTRRVKALAQGATQLPVRSLNAPAFVPGVDFWRKLHQLDGDKLLDGLVWQAFSGPIRQLLDNPYVFESFWSFQRGEIAEDEWKLRLSKGKKAAASLLASGNTAELLGLMFQRIYTLRNQLMHGGATWDSEVNRSQLRDCVNLLGKLVPVVITIMINNPQATWGDAVYPVVNS